MVFVCRNDDRDDTMKGILFYAFSELRRRPLIFASCGIIIWTKIFTAVSLWGVLDVFSNMSEKFSDVLVFVLAELFLLLLLSVCEYMLIADRLKRFDKDYSALRNCGISKHGFCSVQSIQTMVLLSVSVLTAVPLALLLVNGIVSRYQSRLSDFDWIKEIDVLSGLHKLDSTIDTIPFVVIIGVVVAVYALSLANTALACHRYWVKTSDVGLNRMRKRNGRIFSDGQLLQTNDAAVYGKVTARRLHSVMFRANIAMRISFILPFLLVMSAFSFLPEKPTMDYVIRTDTMRNPVSESLADTIDGIEGVAVTHREDATAVYERLTGSEAKEEQYSFIHLEIESDNPKMTIETIWESIKNCGFAFSAPILSYQISNAKNILVCEYFIMQSVFMLVCGIFVTAAVTGDYFRYRQDEFAFLLGLGMDASSIKKMQFEAGMKFILSNLLFSMGTGSGLFVLLSVGGGDKVSWKILVGLIFCLLAAVVLACVISAAHIFTQRRGGR